MCNAVRRPELGGSQIVLIWEISLPPYTTFLFGVTPPKRRTDSKDDHLAGDTPLPGTGHKHPYPANRVRISPLSRVAGARTGEIGSPTMADPFDILGNPGLVPSRPGGAAATLPQQQSTPQPSWPGMNHPAASSSVSSSPMVQQHQQPLYGAPAVGGGGFYQQQNMMQMGQANSAAAAAPALALGSGRGYPVYPGGGQQQQQHHQMGGAPGTVASWGGMNNLALPTPSAAAAATRPSFPSAAPGWNSAYGQPTAPTTITTTTAPVATPQAAPMHTNANAAASGKIGGPSGGGGGGASSGAEWLPPAVQLQAYDSMYRTASAGCAVPGTVSGRAAVQFFSRSGLSKDVLKTVGSGVGRLALSGDGVRAFCSGGIGRSKRALLRMDGLSPVAEAEPEPRCFLRSK